MQKLKAFLMKHKKAVIVVVLLLVIAAGGFGLATSQNNTKINKEKTVQETTKTNEDENGTNDPTTTQSDVETKELKDEKNQDEESKADTSTKTDAQKSTSQSSSTTTNQSQTGNTSTSSHQHVWKEHTAKRWVSKMVTVDDYETKTIQGARFYTYSGTNDLGQPTYTANGPTYWIEDGFTYDDLEEVIYVGLKNADENGLYNGVYYGNYQNVTKTEKVKVGSHQEDQGYYETYVDYYYCDCGARKDA